MKHILIILLVVMSPSLGFCKSVSKSSATYSSDGTLTVGAVSCPNSFHFYNKKGKEIGSINWNDKDGVTFKGDVKNSAKVFFNYFYRNYVREK